MNRLIRIRLLRCLSAACIALLSLDSQAETTAKLERDTIYSDQTVRLIIESTGPVNASPDYSSLRQNFNLLGTSTRQSVEINNGGQTSVKRWVTELEPKSEGTFTIGPFFVGQQSTQRLRLTVLPSNTSAQSAPPREAFVEISLAPQTPYVQQQSVLTLKLFVAINLLEGSLSDPEPENALVERLGDDIQYNANRGGQIYRVVERKYAIFPQRSGEMIIPPIRFHGRAEEKAHNNQPLFSSFFNQGRRIRATSRPLRIEVSPPNPAFSGQHWLPAKRLTFNASAILQDKYEVGKPVTLQLRLAAQGLTAEQLPAFDLPDSDRYKTYADKSQSDTSFNGTDMQGVVIKNIAVVPTQPGELEIPEIKINWWNTKTNSMETATLPFRKILALPSTLDADTALNSPPTKNSESAPNVGVVDTVATPVAGDQYVRSYWKWASMILFIAWLMTLAIFLRSRQPGSLPSKENDSAPAAENVMKKLGEACRHNDAAKARYYLLRWLKQQLPDRTGVTLRDISLISEDPDLNHTAEMLDTYLYAADSTSWDGKFLWDTLSGFQRKTTPSGQNRQIPPLYPA